jgi:hypothetical protein
MRPLSLSGMKAAKRANMRSRMRRRGGLMGLLLGVAAAFVLWRLVGVKVVPVNRDSSAVVLDIPAPEKRSTRTEPASVSAVPERPAQPSAPKSYLGAVPQPLAFERGQFERTLLGQIGQVLSATQSLIRREGPTPGWLELSYRSEPRHPEWAPAMEEIIRARFAPEVFARLNVLGLEDVRVECRTSTCFLEVEWIDRPGVDPMEVWGREAGPLASATGTVSGRPPRETVGDRVRSAMILSFGAKEIDPNRYGDWVEQHRRARNK